MFGFPSGIELNIIGRLLTFQPSNNAVYSVENCFIASCCSEMPFCFRPKTLDSSLSLFPPVDYINSGTLYSQPSLGRVARSHLIPHLLHLHLIPPQPSLSPWGRLVCPQFRSAV